MPTAQQCAAYKVIYYIKYYTGADFFQPYRKDTLPNFYPVDDIVNGIIGGYKTNISYIAAHLKDCDHCANTTCESYAQQVAHAWIKSNQNLVILNGGFIQGSKSGGSGGSSGGGGSTSKPAPPITSAPKGNVDTWGCDAQWGYGSFLAGTCKWFNGAFGGIGESVNKTGQVFGDPLARYLPLFLLGFGAVALLMVLKR